MEKEEEIRLDLAAEGSEEKVVVNPEKHLSEGPQMTPENDDQTESRTKEDAMPFNYSGTETVTPVSFDKEEKEISEVKVEDTHARTTSLAERLSNPMPMMADLDSHMVT